MDLASAIAASDPFQDWTYAAEGGANLVLSYTGPAHPVLDHRALRLSKRSKAKQDDDIPPTSASQGVVFGERVISRFLGKEFLASMKLVLMEQNWLIKVNEMLHISNARPVDRHEASQVDENCSVAVLTEDLVNRKNRLAIEIKPKWGFLPSTELLDESSREIKSNWCRFCLHAYFKAKDRETALDRHDSGYCPLDLYSNTEERVRKALRALWGNWQQTRGEANNLRFFYEGKRIGPNQLSDLETCLRSFSSGSEVSEFSTQERFENLIAPALLESPLLSSLANLQSKLDALDIEALAKLLSGTNFDLEQAKILPQPNLEEWIQFAEKFASQIKEGEDALDSESDPKDLILAYLLSATFKDCSIIIQFDPNEEIAPVANVRFTVIDLDPKPINRMKKYSETDKAIIECWREMLVHQGATQENEYKQVRICRQT